MYESVISHPPENWEIVPSIDIRVGKRLHDEYPNPTNRPVINIDTGAAAFVLRQVQRSDAAPTVVSLMLQEGIAKTHKRSPEYIGGTARGRGWGTDIRINALNPVTLEPCNPEKLQANTVHELKHAADYASPSARLADKEYEKNIQGFKNKFRLAWEVARNNFLARNGDPIGAISNYSGLATMEKPWTEMTVHEYIYYNSPAEKAAYSTADQAQKFPQVIEIYDESEREQKTNI